MSIFSLALIAGGCVLVTNAIRGTKPASIVLSGKNESGKPITARERVSWGILGAILILLGAAQLMNLHSN
jgi:hypothetical protein